MTVFVFCAHLQRQAKYAQRKQNYCRKSVGAFYGKTHSLSAGYGNAVRCGKQQRQKQDVRLPRVQRKTGGCAVPRHGKPCRHASSEGVGHAQRTWLFYGGGAPQRKQQRTAEIFGHSLRQQRYPAAAKAQRKAGEVRHGGGNAGQKGGMPFGNARNESVHGHRRGGSGGKNVAVQTALRKQVKQNITSYTL